MTFKRISVLTVGVLAVIISYFACPRKAEGNWSHSRPNMCGVGIETASIMHFENGSFYYLMVRRRKHDEHVCDEKVELYAKGNYEEKSNGIIKFKFNKQETIFAKMDFGFTASELSIGNIRRSYYKIFNFNCEKNCWKFTTKFDDLPLIKSKI